MDSVMRRAAKVDLNHGQIVDAFRASGALVYNIRQPVDLLVYHGGRYQAVEVKDGPRAPLTDAQKQFIAAGWPVTVVRSTGDVDAALRST